MTNPYGGPVKPIPICVECERKDKRISELEAKYAEVTDGCCPVCDHSLEITDDDLWVCEDCGWKEVQVLSGDEQRPY
jgi:Zn finger protein HypA/HybF involved in hydrogenase expression